MAAFNLMNLLRPVAPRARRMALVPLGARADEADHLHWDQAQIVRPAPLRSVGARNSKPSEMPSLCTSFEHGGVAVAQDHQQEPM